MLCPSDHLVQMGEFSHGVLGYLFQGMTAFRPKAQLKTFRIKKIIFEADIFEANHINSKYLSVKQIDKLNYYL